MAPHVISCNILQKDLLKLY